MYALSTIQDGVVTFTEEALDRTKQFLKEFNPEDSHEIDIEIYNVLRIISQLLTVRMTKELMQLMPPEVFLAMKEKIPKYYVKAYLKHHTHFSLQDLVKKLMKDMNERYAYRGIIIDLYGPKIVVRHMQCFPQRVVPWRSPTL